MLSRSNPRSAMRYRYCSIYLLLIAALALVGSAFVSSEAKAQNLGLVGDEGAEAVHVLNLSTNAVITTINLPSVGSAVGDVAITQDGTLGFVTTFDSFVYVIDLTQATPVLASGTNPIPISNPGEDFAVTPDGNYLTVADGSTVNPLSVIDIAARAEVDTENLTASDQNSVSVCDDGVTVLAGSFNGGVVASGFFDPSTGSLTATANTISVSLVNNVYCAPGSQTGIAISRLN